MFGVLVADERALGGDARALELESEREVRRVVRGRRTRPSSISWTETRLATMASRASEKTRWTSRSLSPVVWKPSW